MTSGACAGFPALFFCDTHISKCTSMSLHQISDLTMEDLNEINFQCIIEGKNYEESLKKIVSILPFIPRSYQPWFLEKPLSILATISICLLGIFKVLLHTHGSFSSY